MKHFLRELKAGLWLAACAVVPLTVLILATKLVWLYMSWVWGLLG